ncbi:unnamed protein product [Rotaria sordida]|uniref:Uncharacterized protein n=1 Tax=Rotaria sordida TaxID=392033 RepID=A0A819WS75_9BILA|nr:unnamed protein product [Rotaria sordida]
MKVIARAANHMLSQHHRLMFIVFSEKKTVRFYSTKDNERFDRRTGYAFAWCFTSTNGFTKLGLVLAIICALFLVIAVSIIPRVIIVKYNTEMNNNSSSLSVNVPKRLGVTTQNLSISQMQTIVNNWLAMKIKGIIWDDARSTDTYTLHIYGDGTTYGNGNFSVLSYG